MHLSVRQWAQRPSSAGARARIAPSVPLGPLEALRARAAVDLDVAKTVASADAVDPVLALHHVEPGPAAEKVVVGATHQVVVP